MIPDTSAQVNKRVRQRLTGSVVLLVVFLAGAASGAAAWRSLGPRKAVRRVSVRVAARGSATYDQLGLSGDQKRSVDSILASIQPQTDAILHDALPRLKELVVSADSSVRHVLTDVQRRTLDSLTAVAGTPHE